MSCPDYHLLRWSMPTVIDITHLGLPDQSQTLDGLRLWHIDKHREKKHS